MYTTKFLFSAVIILILLNGSECYKILGLFPHPGKSHYDVFQPLLVALSEKGHDVTVLSHFPLKNPKPRFRDINLQGSNELLLNFIDMKDVGGYEFRVTKYFGPLMIFHFGNVHCRSSYEVKEVQKLLNSNEKFDLIIAEAFNSDCFLGFLDKFKAPVIGISSCSLPNWLYDRYGNPSNPSYVPDLFMGYPKYLSFLERVENTVLTTFHNLLYRLKVVPNDNEIIKKYIGIHAKDVREYVKSSSLLLVNNHYTLNLPFPRAPNVIEVGGIHIGKVKPLPQNIGRFVNESENGIIYFSLGSLIKGHTFPEEKRKVFLKVFSKLSQRVLWKWENDSMPDKPANVMTQKWMPQLDILCDPNVKAYIGHGGLLGTTEAVHCGVPMVVMPQFGDQFLNAKALEESGGGIILKLQDANEKTLTEALRTVLTPAFQKRAKDLSARFKDRPLPPLETAIYWVEYVARHKGASFMRTAAVDMPWYQVYLLDVLTFLAVFSIVIIAVVVYTLKKLLKLVFSRKANIKEKRH